MAGEPFRRGLTQFGLAGPGINQKQPPQHRPNERHWASGWPASGRWIRTVWELPPLAATGPAAVSNVQPVRCCERRQWREQPRCVARAGAHLDGIHVVDGAQAADGLHRDSPQRIVQPTVRSPVGQWQWQWPRGKRSGRHLCLLNILSAQVSPIPGLLTESHQCTHHCERATTTSLCYRHPDNQYGRLTIRLVSYECKHCEYPLCIFLRRRWQPPHCPNS
ncbi:hypothetical protein BC830DRAFT_795301 [Chytriomyces sp. MP71]|nr:hypothetical protein BC830DRAFT_795301 [Chytriomyces sp. MP71]